MFFLRLESNLGMACLSRTDKDIFSVKTVVVGKRKNLNSLIKFERKMNETKLICEGENEKYNLANVCKQQKSIPLPCTLKNGQKVQLNPS